MTAVLSLAEHGRVCFGGCLENIEWEEEVGLIDLFSCFIFLEMRN